MTPEQLEYQQALVKQIKLQEELILALKQKIVGLEDELNYYKAIYILKTKEMQSI